MLGPSGRLTAAGDRHLGITRECHERVADTGSGKAFWNGAHRASLCSVGADNTDALAAVEKRVDTPNEMPELLVELSDGTLRGIGFSRGDVCRISGQSLCSFRDADDASRRSINP